MAQNLKSLIHQAVQLRVVGNSWKAIGKELKRKPKTCAGWPKKYARDWADAYRQAESHRYEETCKEAHTRIHALMRHEDAKVANKANEIWQKYGAANYGKGGPMEISETPAQAATPTSPNAEVWAVGNQVLDEEWARMNAERAKEGKPPFTADEFVIEYNRQYDQRPVPPPVILHIDKNGNSIDPPEEESPESDDDAESRPREPSGAWGDELRTIGISREGQKATFRDIPSGFERQFRTYPPVEIARFRLALI